MDSIEQVAEIQSVNGTAHIIRDGFFLAIEPRMLLQAGDRVSTEQGSTVVIGFTGVNQPLVVQNGSAATLYKEATDSDSAPQWMVADLYGNDVYFAEENAEVAKAAPTDSFNGLFGTTEDSGTGYPVLEVAAGVGVAALIASEASDDEDESTANSTTMAQADTTDSAAENTEQTDPPANTNDGSDSLLPEPLNDALTQVLPEELTSVLPTGSSASPLSSVAGSLTDGLDQLGSMLAGNPPI